MTIIISKQEIFDEVEKRTSLEGTVIPERFEGVWASKDEGAFLDSYWLEGYTAAIQLLKRYLTSNTVNHTLNVHDSNEELIITAYMPSRYNHLLDGNIATAIKMMIVCNIVHGWLNIKHPEAASKYDEESKGYAEDIRIKVLYRAAPYVDFGKTKSDYCSIYPRHEYINQGKRDNCALDQQWAKCKTDVCIKKRQ